MGYKDPEKQRAFQLNWITARKRKYIEKMGCCVFCGSLDFQIHHVDPEKKITHAIWSWAEDRLEMELAKCIALCKHCHDTLHALMRRKEVRHGSAGAYRIGCRCDACRQYKAEDHKRRHARRSQANRV